MPPTFRETCPRAPRGFDADILRGGLIINFMSFCTMILFKFFRVRCVIISVVARGAGRGGGGMLMAISRSRASALSRPYIMAV